MTTPDQPSVLSGRRVIWPWVAATAAALAAAVTAGATVTVLSSLAGELDPPATTGNDRWACRAAWDAGRAEPGTYVAIASVAIESTDPGIAEAGWKLLEAASVAQSADSAFEGQFDAMMAIDRAKLDLAWACAARFGDGPW